MPSSTPARIRADLELLTVLEQILGCVAPEEGCALLLGKRLVDHWRLHWIWPCCNAWPVPEERVRRFGIDPREQLLAQKWARAQGLDLLGAAHSHPSTRAVPSFTDRSLTLQPALMLILGRNNTGQELVAWWFPEADGPPVVLPLGPCS